MKAGLIITLLAAQFVAAQDANSPGRSVISSPAPTNSSAFTNASTGSGILFTNQTGTTYSIADVDRRLSELKIAVDQALPALSAFNKSYATSADSSPIEKLGGVLSDVLSGRRTASSTNAGTSSGGSSISSNLVGVLQGLLNTNKTSFNKETLKQLETLEKNLEPVITSLQALNVQPSTTDTTGGTTNSPPLTPTGREK